MATPTEIDVEELGQVKSLKEIKKERRTVMLGQGLTLPKSEGERCMSVPLTPPLSERASGDVCELFSPQREERYESVDLTSETGEEVLEWHGLDDTIDDTAEGELHEVELEDVWTCMGCINDRTRLSK
jgi:hypothetical protein